ncbi:hypothetical protein N0V93_001565 [Gnomoniopsis smithogilvyi]|uniref:Uncharacterized protein n=1 Tax=Gnomoniopsis smithogilvyi TaxID=1191159 RepID=A0A9W9D2Q9_9PEZI|nr:hypothetical protein N0V93_001565 [Gnomoniopsis smithogilvyi]
MYWTSLLYPLLAVPACQALPSVDKRGAATDATLYAYGTNISAFPVVYDAATTALYVAQTNQTLSGSVSITWDIPSITKATTTSTVGTLTNGTEVGGIWIDASDDLFDAVLVQSNSTLGFAIYGRQLVYYDGTSVESEFWAKEVYQADGTTVWALHWNSNNEDRTGAVPVVLKTVASS